MKDYLKDALKFGTAFLISAGFTYMSYRNVPYMNDYISHNKEDSKKTFLVDTAKANLDSKEINGLAGLTLSTLFLSFGIYALVNKKKKDI